MHLGRKKIIFSPKKQSIYTDEYGHMKTMDLKAN